MRRGRDRVAVHRRGVEIHTAKRQRPVGRALGTQETFDRQRDDQGDHAIWKE